MMNINFFDDRSDAPRMREDVRITRARLEVSPEGKRVAVDLELTPFIERPTVQLVLVNEAGGQAGRLTIIETLDRVMSVVMHIRDQDPTATYHLHARVYYASIEEDLQPQVVDTLAQLFALEAGNVVSYTAPDQSTNKESSE